MEGEQPGEILHVIAQLIETFAQAVQLLDRKPACVARSVRRLTCGAVQKRWRKGRKALAHAVVSERAWPRCTCLGPDS
jgi:hypothetical protein